MISASSVLPEGYDGIESDERKFIGYMLEQETVSRFIQSLKADVSKRNYLEKFMDLNVIMDSFQSIRRPRGRADWDGKPVINVAVGLMLVKFLLWIQANA